MVAETGFIEYLFGQLYSILVANVLVLGFTFLGIYFDVFNVYSLSVGNMVYCATKESDVFKSNVLI